MCDTRTIERHFVCVAAGANASESFPHTSPTLTSRRRGNVRILFHAILEVRDRFPRCTQAQGLLKERSAGEIVCIADRLFGCYLGWLEGGTLAQTLGTCLYLHGDRAAVASMLALQVSARWECFARFT